jgi:hypothetical protein
MKTKNVNNKLAFNKAAVTELNNDQLQGVNGGSSGVCLPSIIIITIIKTR